MNIGMIFPGQGAQFLGMGKELYDRERLVQEYFELASGCLETNFVRLCFASSDKELRETGNAQTAIFLVSAAITQLLAEKYNIHANIVAGHSSGEYAALFAAGGMSFVDALYLLKKRSTFMQAATQQTEGGMAAILNVPLEKIHEICQRYDDPSGNTSVAEVVNYNSADQFVIAATLPELKAIQADVKEIKGKAIELNVAGAFHSRLMQQAAHHYGLYMVKVDFKDTKIPLISNVTAKPLTNAEDLKNSLIQQVHSHVLWWPSMYHLYPCDIIIEIGPNIKYSKMLKRAWPDKQIMSINTPEDIEQLHTVMQKPFEKTEMDLVIEEELQEKKSPKKGLML